jgi:hypothetical protein
MVETRTIGARIPDGVHFRYLTDTNELEIRLPRGEGVVGGYANGKRFTETQFKVMCCRFSYVTQNDPNHPPHPSDFAGNNGQFNESTTNPPGWAPPTELFRNKRVDPPFVVAVVRKVLEDNPRHDEAGYCPSQNNCQ